MGQSKKANALLDMYCQAAARGANVTADATMFSVAELMELVSAAAQSAYKCKLTITRSQALRRDEQSRVLAAADGRVHVLFTTSSRMNLKGRSG